MSICPFRGGKKGLREGDGNFSFPARKSTLPDFPVKPGKARPFRNVPDSLRVFGEFAHCAHKMLCVIMRGSSTFCVSVADALTMGGCCPVGGRGISTPLSGGQGGLANQYCFYGERVFPLKTFQEGTGNDSHQAQRN